MKFIWNDENYLKWWKSYKIMKIIRNDENWTYEIMKPTWNHWNYENYGTGTVYEIKKIIWNDENYMKWWKLHEMMITIWNR